MFLPFSNEWKTNIIRGNNIITRCIEQLESWENANGKSFECMKKMNLLVKTICMVGDTILDPTDRNTN